MTCFLNPTYPHCVHQARRQTRGKQLSLSAISNVTSTGKRRNIEKKHIQKHNSTLPSITLCFCNEHVGNEHLKTSISAELWSKP